MEGLFEIIKTLGSKKTPVNPTQIYNEGWMTRLLMHYSVKEGLTYKEIGIDIEGTFKNKYWTSEALISSAFISATSKREGYTHPDIAIGDFSVNYKESGRLEVEENAKEFGIIEAKMKSQLSKETANYTEFNQASRNVACIAANTQEGCTTFFYVVLLESQRDHKKKDGTTIINVVNNDYVFTQIEARVDAHNKANKEVIDNKLLDRAKKCKIGVITYEHWIEAFKSQKIKEELYQFYNYCKIFNDIKPHFETC